MKLVDHLDFQGNQALNLIAEKLASAPGSPVAGRLYYNTTNNQLNLYNGTSFAVLAAGDITLGAIPNGATLGQPLLAGSDVVAPTWSITGGLTSSNGGATLTRTSGGNTNYGTAYALGTSFTATAGGNLTAQSPGPATQQGFGLNKAAIVVGANPSYDYYVTVDESQVPNTFYLGVIQATLTAVTPSDVLNIVMAPGGVVTLKKNGTTIYTWATSGTGTYRPVVDIWMNTGSLNGLSETVPGVGAPVYGQLDLSLSTSVVNRLALANFAVGTSGLPLLGAGAGSSAYGALDLGASGATGTLAAGRFPALTGDVTTTAGSLATTVALVGGASAANIADAVTKRHTQNTDTGTTGSTFAIDSDGATPIKLKNSSGELQVRNDGDSAYLDLRVKNLFVTGTQTIVDSNQVNIGDSNLELNADIDANASNSNGGVSIRRLIADAVGTGTVDTTSGSTAVVGTGTTFTGYTAGDVLVVGANRYRIASITDATNLVLFSAAVATVSGSAFSVAVQSNAVMEFDNSTTARWQATFGSVGSLQTKQVVLKHAEDVGNGAATSIVVTHNLGTRDVTVMVRENASPYAAVLPTIEMTSTTTITLTFLTAPTSAQYRVIITG